MSSFTILFKYFIQLVLSSFIRSCHEDLILTRKSNSCAGIAFILGDSVGGSKLIEQTLLINTESDRVVYYTGKLLCTSNG